MLYVNYATKPLSTAKGFKDKSDRLKAVVLTLLRTINHKTKYYPSSSVTA